MNILSSTLSEGGIGYTTANENFFRLDATAILTVKSHTTTAPPGSPTEGDRYLIPASGTSGAWVGHENTLAIYHNAVWLYLTPQEGWSAWVDDEDQWHYWNGSLFISRDELIVPSARVLSSVLPRLTSGFTTISGTAYFVYLGKLARTVTLNKVRMVVKTAGTGAQTAEVGIFSSPAEPSRAGQSLTKIAATGTVDSMLTTGQKANTSAFAQSVTAGTHVWAGVRTALASTQPQIAMCFGDKDQGRILELAGAGALTGAGPWAGGIIVDTAQGLGPDIEITLD